MPILAICLKFDGIFIPIYKLKRGGQMGKLGCDKGECFYNSSGLCTNIAVSVTTDCGLYLDTNNRKEWKPKTLSKPAINAQNKVASAKKAGAVA